MRILFISSWFPYPPDNGSKLRIYNLLRGLAQYHAVTLLVITNQPTNSTNPIELQSICEKIQVEHSEAYNPSSFRASVGLLSSTPRSIQGTFSPKIAQAIQSLLTDYEYDLIIASQLGTASYSRYFRGFPTLFEEVEVAVPYEAYANARSIGQRIRHGFTWLKHSRYLARLLQDFRACTVVSERERQLLSQVIPGYQAIEVIPNCINLADYRDFRINLVPDSLIFTGSFRYYANHDAMMWFLQEVYPRIRAQVPNVHLTITGDHANLPLPTADNVTLTGFIKDIRPLLSSAAISLAPIRVGGGTRLKILEAMALRTPVVSTSKGAEGLEVEPGKHLLIADTPESFEEMVISLLKQPELRQRIVDNAYKLMCEKYDWGVVMPRFLSLVQKAENV